MRTHNLEIVAGNTQTFTLTFSDASGLIEITAWSVAFTVRDKTLAVALTKTVIDHSDPTHGETKIILSSADTALEPGKYSYAIRVTTGAQEIFTIIAGSLVVRGY